MYQTAIASGATNIADAANYIQCQKLESINNNNNNNNADDNVNNNEGEAQQQGEGDDDENAVQYYIGPYCHSVHTTSTDTAPTSISIGLFSDENCYSPITTNVNMTELLGGVQLSYHLFKHTTSTTNKKNPMQCLSCLESNNNNNNDNNNDVNDVDDVNEMCENLYTVSAKCESTTGLQNGFIQMHRKNNNNDASRSNQVENEFMACTYIQSLLYNSYTETGIINLRIPQDYIIRTMTSRQRNTVILLMILLVAICSAIYYYHYKIQQLIHPSMMVHRDNKAASLVREGVMS
jgi:hypothetical protein